MWDQIHSDWPEHVGASWVFFVSMLLEFFYLALRHRNGRLQVLVTMRPCCFLLGWHIACILSSIAFFPYCHVRLVGSGSLRKFAPQRWRSRSILEVSLMLIRKDYKSYLHDYMQDWDEASIQDSGCLVTFWSPTLFNPGCECFWQAYLEMDPEQQKSVNEFLKQILDKDLAPASSLPRLLAKWLFQDRKTCHPLLANQYQSISFLLSELLHWTKEVFLEDDISVDVQNVNVASSAKDECLGHFWIVLKCVCCLVWFSWAIQVVFPLKLCRLISLFHCHFCCRSHGRVMQGLVSPRVLFRLWLQHRLAGCWNALKSLSLRRRFLSHIERPSWLLPNVLKRIWRIRIVVGVVKKRTKARPVPRPVPCPKARPRPKARPKARPASPSLQKDQWRKPWAVSWLLQRQQVSVTKNAFVVGSCPQNVQRSLKEWRRVNVSVGGISFFGDFQGFAMWPWAIYKKNWYELNFEFWKCFLFSLLQWLHNIDLFEWLGATTCHESRGLTVNSAVISRSLFQRLGVQNAWRFFLRG